MRTAALLLLLLIAVVGAAPKAETGSEGLRVRTARYVATFDADSGLLAALTLADGTPLLTNTRLYGDVLPDGRRNFSAKAKAAPNATTQADGSLLVEVAGALLDTDGKPHPAYPFTYTASYRFDDTARVRVVVSVVPGFDSEAVFGFLGHVLSTADQREFFVNTADGLVSEMAATHGGRTYQSESEPLDLENPYLGVLLRTGQVLQFRLVSGAESLLNVFFHDSGTGPTHLFLCPLCGANPRRARQGEAWRQELVIEAMPLAAWTKGR
jgi:hypothetical protein